jgi:hypothetical protein
MRFFCKSAASGRIYGMSMNKAPRYRVLVSIGNGGQWTQYSKPITLEAATRLSARLAKLGNKTRIESAATGGKP